MRVSLENKISYLADKGAVYKIGRDRVSDKYILIVESGPIEGSVFLSKSISKVVSLFYNECVSLCTCGDNDKCSYCK